MFPVLKTPPCIGKRIASHIKLKVHLPFSLMSIPPKTGLSGVDSLDEVWILLSFDYLKEQIDSPRYPTTHRRWLFYKPHLKINWRNRSPVKYFNIFITYWIGSKYWYQILPRIADKRLRTNFAFGWTRLCLRGGTNTSLWRPDCNWLLNYL